MEETKEVKLPSGKVAVIRAYTTRRDDRQVEEITNKGLKADFIEGGEPSVSIDLASQLAGEDRYVELLTETIDGKSATLEVIEDLRSEDYAVLKEAVKLVASPKGDSKS